MAAHARVTGSHHPPALWVRKKRGLAPYEKIISGGMLRVKARTTLNCSMHEKHIEILPENAVYAAISTKIIQPIYKVARRGRRMIELSQKGNKEECIVFKKESTVA